MEPEIALRDRVADGCDQVVVWSLVALVALLPLALNPYGNIYYELPKMALFRFAAMAAAAAWATKAIVTGRLSWVQTPLDWPLAALVGSGVVSTILALNRHVSLYGYINRFDGLLSLACYIVLFYATINFIRTRYQLRYLVVAATASATLVALSAVLERIGVFIIPYTYQLGGTDPARSSATYGNPLYLGAFLALTVPITLALFLYLKVRLDESADTHETASHRQIAAFWGTALAAAIQIAALAFTQGRAAWLGVAVGIGLMSMLLLRGPIKMTRRHLAVAAVIPVASFLIFGAVALSPRRAASGPSGVAQTQPLAVKSPETAYNRLYMWRMTVAGMTSTIVRDGMPRDRWQGASRFLLGYGLDSYIQVFPRFRPRDWYRAIKENAIPDKPHNDLLQVFVGQGLVGLAAYVATLLALFFTTIGGARRSKRLLDRCVLVGLTTACAAYIVQLQFSFNVIGVAPLFWIAAGLAVSFACADERRSRTVIVQAPATLRREPLRTAIQASLLLAIAGLVAWGAVGLGRAVAADVYVRDGQKAQEQGLGDESLVLFNDAVAANPYEARFPMLTAQAAEQRYLRTRDPVYSREGIALARQAQRLDPYFMEPYFTEASIYRSLAGRTRKSPLRRAEKIYRHILELDRYNQDAYYNLGITLYDLRAFDQAVKTLETAVDLKPYDPQAYEALGASLLGLRRTNEAIRALRKALRLDPGNSYLREKLREFESKGTARD